METNSEKNLTNANTNVNVNVNAKPLLWNYVNRFGKLPFLDQDDAVFDGLDVFGKMRWNPEENYIKGNITNQEIGFQGVTISVGTDREVQLRTFVEGGDVVDHRITLGGIFPGKEVIVLTTGDRLRGCVPVCQDAKDLLLFCQEVDDYVRSLPTDCNSDWKKTQGMMYKVGVFFYQNHPNKIESALGELLKLE